MQRLTGWDASMLYSETPTVHMHTLKVAVVELGARAASYSLDEFREIIGRRLYRLPPFRYQLVDTPLGLHHPMWRENCPIDLDYHIRTMRVPQPGGRRELDDAVGQIAGVPLDRTRPLWELHLVAGLAGDRIAVVGKIHHALADGVASANLLAAGMDLDPGPHDHGDDHPVDGPASAGALVGAALRDHLRSIGRLPSAVKYTAEGVRRVRASSRDLSPKLTWPFTPPHSFINHGLDARRRFATATLPLTDAKTAAKSLGATINDLVLAMSAGALRSLQLRLDGAADRLLASVPVSFDNTPDRLSGNLFSGMLVPLPTDVDDPARRLQDARSYAASSKEAHHLLGPELLFRWSEYLPPTVSSALFDRLSARQRPNRIFTLPISNVKGPTRRGRFDEGVVTEIYSVGPLTVGSGLNITVWSYVDQLNISVLSDGLTVIDPHEVTGAMMDDFVALRAAAGMHSEVTEVPTAMPNTK